MPINSPNRQVSVTLSVDSWKAIISFISSGCASRDEKWSRWGQDVTRSILDSVYSPTQKHASQQDNRGRYIATRDELDHDYDREPYQPYTTRDLQNDLGMESLSSDEFSSWLDDQG